MKKVFISIAIWGNEYITAFLNFNLASQLAQSNIPYLSNTCSVTYQIITTSGDKRNMQEHPLMQKLSEFCKIQWALLDIDPKLKALVNSEDTNKYSKLSVLQNYAMQKANTSDIIIFNYADFIWANGSLKNIIHEFTNDIDALTSFCLPVDQTKGADALKKMQNKRTGLDNILDLSPRDATTIAIENLHEEAKLRIWGNKKFTSFPSYILWPVKDEGFLITAYHQTILAMRVEKNNAIYHNGIFMNTLDGFYSAVLAANARVKVAINSDEIFIFSLYETKISTKIKNYNYRELDAMHMVAVSNLLKNIVSLSQRKLATTPIQVIKQKQNIKLWRDTKNKSQNMLTKLHNDVQLCTASYANNLYGATNNSDVSRAYNRFVTFIKILKIFTLIDFIPKSMRNCLPRMIRKRINRVVFTIKVRAFTRGLSKEKNIKKAIILILTDKIKILVKKIESNTKPIYFGKIELLSKKAAAYLQIGLIPELVLNKLKDPFLINKLLNKSENSLKKLINISPNYIEGYKALARNLWMQGKFDESLLFFQLAEKKRISFLQSNNLPSDIALLPVNCLHVIGLMGHIDAFIKNKILNNDPRTYYIDTNNSQIVNPIFFEYWNKFVKTGIPDIKGLSPEIVKELYTVDWNWTIPQANSEVKHVHTGISRIQRQWYKEKKPPLLSLTNNHKSLLEQFKQKHGITQKDWFVCLHVRSAGFYNETHGTAQDFRNSPIEDYFTTIESVVNKGGWVIRMGDTASPPISLAQLTCDRSKVIDYAHSADRSSELDVLLSASCRLFISSSSGLHTVALAFGRPVCYVNVPIYQGFPWHPDKIFIPKLYYSLKLNKILTMKEILSTTLVHADHQHLLQAEGIALLRNTPDEIEQTVLEALFGDDYIPPNYKLAKEARTEFIKLNEIYKCDISGKIGLYFCNKYSKTIFQLDSPNHLRKEKNDTAAAT